MFITIASLEENAIVKTSASAQNSTVVSSHSTCPIGAFGKCYFTYGELWTPIVISADPISMPSILEAQDTVMTLTGFFGGFDYTKVNISVGASTVCIPIGPVKV